MASSQWSEALDALDRLVAIDASLTLEKAAKANCALAAWQYLGKILSHIELFVAVGACASHCLAGFTDLIVLPIS